MSPDRVPRKLSDRAQQVIADEYLIGSVPADPHAVLQDISRSVSILGRLLNGLAEQYAQAGKSAANIITITGSVLWGIVEISVPQSVLFYLSRGWFKLVAAVGLVTVVLGIVTNTSGMPSVGVDLLVAAFLGQALSSQLHRFMNTGNVNARRAKTALVFVVAVLAVVGTLYLLLSNAHTIANKLQWMSNEFMEASKHVPTALKSSIDRKNK